MVVVKVNIDAIIMNKINFHIASRPLSNSFLEKNIYIIKINKKMKKKGLKFLINAENFIFDNMITNNINTTVPLAGVGSTKRTRTGARFASVRERLREVTYFVYQLENTKINLFS